MTASGDAVNHPSLKDAAAAYLREQILTGQLRPGTKIDQDEISDALGISRLPVREALIELAHESLIDAVPRRGAFVARLERVDIIDHYRIFGLIAGLAASRAATALTDEQLESLAEFHAAFVAATDADALTRWNHRFHRVINQAGGSRASCRWSPSCRAACLCATSSSCPTGRRSPRATTPGSWRRSRRATRTRRNA